MAEALQGISALRELLPAAQTEAKPRTESALPFQSIFEDAVRRVNESQAEVNAELAKLAAGETDDVHNLMISSSKATLSVQLLVQLRNSALEAYNELMRVNL